MVLNSRSLTNQKDGLVNLLNLINQDIFRSSGGRKTKKTIASLQARLPPALILTFLSPFLRPATQAILEVDKK